MLVIARLVSIMLGAWCLEDRVNPRSCNFHKLRDFRPINSIGSKIAVKEAQLNNRRRTLRRQHKPNTAT